MTQRMLAVALALVVCACGSSPTAPAMPGTTQTSAPVPAMQRVQFVHGITKAPIAGAPITTRRGAETFTTVTTSDGTANLLIANGDYLRANAQGHLLFEDIKDDATVFALWPNQDDTFLLQLQHVGNSMTPLMLMGTESLAPAPQAFVVLPPEFRGTRMENAYREGSGMITQASGMPFVVVSEAPSDAPSVTSVVDPGWNGLASYERKMDSARGITILGCVIHWGSQMGVATLEQIVTAVAHEGGHCYGMGHTSAPGMMSLSGAKTFSFDEEIAMKMARQRRSGWMFQDRNPRVVALGMSRPKKVAVPKGDCFSAH